MKENKEFSRHLLEISLLGKFRVKIDGVAVDEKRWVRRSAQSLVKLLAVKSFHTMHREQIMDLLWAEESPKTALNNLNKAIHAARRTLEPNLAKGSESRYILTSKNQISLDSPGSLSIDLDEFEKLASYALQNNDLEAGQKAVKLYRGDLLIEDIYEDWLYARRESSRIQFRKLAAKLSELHAAQGERAAGIEILKKLIAEDATDEYVHRLLMRFYAETGSKYQALKQFEQCRAALLNLGIEPEPETLKLEQSIKRGEIAATENKSASPKSITNGILSLPKFTPLTFQNGIITSARFSPDGKKVILSATWDYKVSKLYAASLDSNEFVEMEMKDAEIYSVSADGKLAIGLNLKMWNGVVNAATLAFVPLSGCVAKKLLKIVHGADWNPSKTVDNSYRSEDFIAAVGERNGKNVLEYPIGVVIYETDGWLSPPRFSPDGKKIAFIEYPVPMDDEGFIVVLDLADEKGKKQILTDSWITIQGLAWVKDEIYFTASNMGNKRKIYAVNLKREVRLIFEGIGNLKIQDFSKDGKALITDEKSQINTIACFPDDEIENDLTWHERTFPRTLTNDGKTLLMEECGVIGSNPFKAYLRKTDGSATRLIADTSPLALSLDEKHVLLRMPKPDNCLALLTVETGEIRRFEKDAANSLVYSEYADFFPDGKRIVFAANEPHRGMRIYFQDIAGGRPVCFTPDEEGIKMYAFNIISPDGKQIILKNSENRLCLYQIADGTSSVLQNLDTDFYFTGWLDDCQSIFVRQWGTLPAVIYKYSLIDETKKKWIEIMPKNPNGVKQLLGVRITPDCEAYVYYFNREFSDLYLMEDSK